MPVRTNHESQATIIPVLRLRIVRFGGILERALSVKKKKYGRLVEEKNHLNIRLEKYSYSTYCAQLRCRLCRFTDDDVSMLLTKQIGYVFLNVPAKRRMEFLSHFTHYMATKTTSRGKRGTPMRLLLLLSSF